MRSFGFVLFWMTKPGLLLWVRPAEIGLGRGKAAREVGECILLAIAKFLAPWESDPYTTDGSMDHLLTGWASTEVQGAFQGWEIELLLPRILPVVSPAQVWARRGAVMTCTGVSVLRKASWWRLLPSSWALVLAFIIISFNPFADPDLQQVDATFML